MAWTPDKISDNDLESLLKYLKEGDRGSRHLYNKFWCWKMNYRNKDYDNLLQQTGE